MHSFTHITIHTNNIITKIIIITHILDMHTHNINLYIYIYIYKSKAERKSIRF